MDLKAKIDEIAAKLKKDPALLKQFESDPVKALERISGVDLPDEQIKPLIAAVKAKMASGDAADLLGNIGSFLK